MKSIKLLSIMTFFLCFNVFGQEQKTNIFVKDLSKLELSDSSYLRKTAFEIIIQTNRFNLLLNPKLNNNFLLLTMNVENSVDEYYSISFKLLRGGKKLINAVESFQVPKEKVLLRCRILLYKLLYGQNYDEKERKLIKNKIIPLEAKKNNLSNFLKNELNNKDKSEKSLLTDEDEDADDEDEQESNKKFKKKKKKKKLSIQQFDSLDLDLRKNKKKDNLKKDSLNLMKYTEFYFGQSEKTYESETIISLEHQVKEITFEFNTILNYEYSDYRVHLGASFSKVVESSSLEGEEYKLPISKKIKLRYGKNFYYLNAAVSLSYDTSPYLGVGKRSTGIKVYENSLFYIGGKLEGKVFVFNRRFLLGASINRSLAGNTNLNTFDNGFTISAQKLDLYLQLDLYKNLGFRLTSSDEEFNSIAVNDYKVKNKKSVFELVYRQ